MSVISSVPLLFRLLRVHQYTKNIFVFIPLFFSGQLFDVNNISKTIATFVSFCFAASVIYILNDIRDQEEDRNHPTKCRRPIASREVTTSVAIVIAIGLLILAMFVAYNISINVMITVLAYIVLNLLYVFWLKQYAIVDITIIAVGFVLRTVGGAFAISGQLSQWLVLMVFLLCMFLAMGKRYDDVLLIDKAKTDGDIRKSSKGYSQTFIIVAMTFLSTINTVCYILYTIIPNNTHYVVPEYLYTTTVWVVLGNLRYLQLTFVEENSGSPTKIFLKDRAIQSSVVLWVIHLMVLLYL